MSKTPTNTETTNKSEMVGKLNSARELAAKYGMTGHGEKLTTIWGRQVGRTYAALMDETRKRIEAETELALLRRQVAEACYGPENGPWPAGEETPRGETIYRISKMNQRLIELGITPDLLRDSQTDNDTRTDVCGDDSRAGGSPLDRLANQVDGAGLYDS